MQEKEWVDEGMIEKLKTNEKKFERGTKQTQQKKRKTETEVSRLENIFSGKWL